VLERKLLSDRVVKIEMSSKRAATVALWVLLAIVPGGFWAMGLYLAFRAARTPISQMNPARTSVLPSIQG